MIRLFVAQNHKNRARSAANTLAEASAAPLMLVSLRAVGAIVEVGVLVGATVVGAAVGEAVGAREPSRRSLSIISFFLFFCFYPAIHRRFFY